MRRRDDSVLQEILPPDERVIEAVVARYQRVAPAVTRFARSLTGNGELQVRLGTQAAGGDSEIVLDPGVFQAAYARKAPVTPTEVALASALHEVVHLIATDFESTRALPKAWERFRPNAAPAPIDDGSLDSPLDAMDRNRPGPDPDAVALLERLFLEDVPSADGDQLGTGDDDQDAAAMAAAIRDAEAEDGATRDDLDPDAGGLTVLDAVAEIAGPPGEAMFLSIEDARQERRFFEGYAGARSVLRDLYLAAMPEAMQAARPIGQFALGCFLLAGEYAARDRVQRGVAPHVATALDEAAPFLEALAGIEDVWTVGEVALELVAIARRHGLLRDAESNRRVADQKLAMEADGAAIAESVDAVRMVTPPLASAESYEQTRQAAMSVSAEAGIKASVDHAGDPATDQLVKVSQAPTVYLPTGQGGKLVVESFPDRFRAFGVDGRSLIAEAAHRWAVSQRRVSGELFPLFAANQRRGLRSGFDAGDLSPYAALLLGGGYYERMFERRDLPSRRSYGVSLLVDGSASMLQPKGGARAPWALAAATLGAWTLANLCDELQIDFEVALFNRSFPAEHDDSEASFSKRRSRATGALRRSHGGNAERLTRTVNHYLVKGFDAPWRSAEDVLAGLFFMAAKPQEAARQARRDPAAAPPISMFDKAANVDEFNLAYAAERLVDRRVSTRIMVVLADGMTRGSVQALADAVSGIERGGAIVLGIGIGDDTVQAAYGRHRIVEQPDELAAAMVDGVRSTLFKTLAVMGGDTWWAQSSSSLASTTTFTR